LCTVINRLPQKDDLRLTTFESSVRTNTDVGKSFRRFVASCIYPVYTLCIQERPVEIRTPTHCNLMSCSTTVLLTVLSPNNIHPPLSTLCAFISARKNSARLSKCYYLFSVIYLKLRNSELNNLKFRKAGSVCSVITPCNLQILRDFLCFMVLFRQFPQQSVLPVSLFFLMVMTVVTHLLVRLFPSSLQCNGPSIIRTPVIRISGWPGQFWEQM